MQHRLHVAKVFFLIQRDLEGCAALNVPHSAICELMPNNVQVAEDFLNCV